ncbi:MAG TPA: twin-arginine translocase subunit TatC [Ignavibacteriaceae bacterium]|nr:twin-arginine translocase subunit TatC [Ignavibacteriaceae bacterium]
MAAEETARNSDEGKTASDVEMSFLDHVEELRWRIIYAIIGILIFTIVAWFFIDSLIEIVLLKPARDANASLQNLRPFGQLFLYVQVSIVVGIVASLPNIFYQLWQFIAPALKKRERKYILWIVFFSTFCFLAGIAFAYFVMLPLTMKFAAQFGTAEISNEFAIDEYMSIIISVMLAAGVVFELPMISFFLSKLGILTPKFMRKYRRHAIVIILVLAAFLTPGADPVSQVILAVPLVLLYEISIFISKISSKKSA